MMIWMLLSSKDISTSHRNTVNYPSDVRFVTSLMKFQCRPCGIFEGLEISQYVEVIAPTTFAKSASLGDIIKKVVLSNFTGMIRSVLVIFETGVINSWYYNK